LKESEEPLAQRFRGDARVVSGAGKDFNGVLWFLFPKPPCDSPHLLVRAFVPSNERCGKEHAVSYRNVKVGDTVLVALEPVQNGAVFIFGVVLALFHGCLELVFGVTDMGAHCNAIGLPRHFMRFDGGHKSRDDLSQGLGQDIVMGGQCSQYGIGRDWGVFRRDDGGGVVFVGVDGRGHLDGRVDQVANADV